MSATHPPSTAKPGGPGRRVPTGARAVLALSTTAFTLMFAAWLMFGVLGLPIRDEFGLSDVQLSWLSAVAILNGSLWRLPAGIAADRFGGRLVFTVLLLVTAAFCVLVSMAGNYTVLLLLAFGVGFAGNSFTAASRGTPRGSRVRIRVSRWASSGPVTWAPR